MPPKIAPIEVVIIPIESDTKGIRTEEFVKHVFDLLSSAGVRVHIDEREDQSVGRKFNHWEVKGVPLRFEIGNKEISGKVATAVRRDTGEKLEISEKQLQEKTKEILEDIQKNLFEKAKKFLKENTTEVKDYKEFKSRMKKKRGYIKVFWKEDKKIEKKIKEETKATSRVRLLDNKKKGKCFYSGEETDQIWYFAQAY